MFGEVIKDWRERDSIIFPKLFSSNLFFLRLPEVDDSEGVVRVVWRPQLEVLLDWS